MAYKTITAKFDGKCKGCGAFLTAGDGIVWESLHKTVFCQECGKGKIKAAQSAAAAAVAAKAKAKLLAAKGMPQVVSQGHTSILDIPKPGTPVVEPQTQKGKGITVLQGAGLLPSSMAIVCQTVEQAIAAFHKLAPQGKRFARPCPKTPRHGFVDSREVASEADVMQVWAETREADPEGELILMPFVQAEYNCVWRPGLLAVGPGHDGATAGHDSISVFLTPDYSPAWKDLAAKAGVKIHATGAEQQSPFIEAVSNANTDVIVTQIRGGDAECPTEPDWIPAPMTVTAVIEIDGSVKADAASMLAWEEQAKTLGPGTIVYDQGGNQGDHWSVHARLNGVAVVTSFKPAVGQSLPKMGTDPVPFEPQAVIWGLLGGLAGGPVMGPETPVNRRKRTRATVAAIMGAHHGLRMGGDAGVHLGASVGLFLRLGQAAVWGEARHAYSHVSHFDPKSLPGIGPVKGKSRQQIFSMILDDWSTGRAGLRDVARCYHLPWSSGYGGKAWAAIAHSLVTLDAAAVELVRIPSQTNVKKLFAALVNSVNLAHNGVSAGCFLNKFCEGVWFDMAASLDPRAACFAGPSWYEASLTDGAKRMSLYEAMQSMSPINVGYDAPKGNVIKSTKTVETQTTIKATPGMHAQTVQTVHVSMPTIQKPEGSKVGSFENVALGGVPGLPGAAKSAQCKGAGSVLHTQISLTAGGYVSGEILVPDDQVEAVALALAGLGEKSSMSGSGVTYKVLTVEAGAIKAGAVTLLTLTAGVE